MARAVLGLILGLMIPCAVMAAEAGPWEETHRQEFGDWASVCEQREAPARIQQRCYILRSDEVAPRPRQVFVHMIVMPFEIEFVFERHTRGMQDGFRIERDGEIVWKTNRIECLRGWLCIFTDREMRRLHDAMRGGGTLRILFQDRFGVDHDVSWPLDGAENALDDMRAQARARGLR